MDDTIEDVPLIDNHINAISSEDESGEENPSKKQKESSIFPWSGTYSSKVDAIAVIEAEKTWYKNRMRVTREGAKETYKCKHKGC